MASIYEMFLENLRGDACTYYQEAKIKEIIYYFNCSRLGKMLRLCL